MNVIQNSPSIQTSIPSRVQAKLEAPLAEASQAQDGYTGSVASPAEDFLTLGRKRYAMPAGGLLADVEFRYADGRKVVVPDANSANQQIDKTKDGSLESIRFSGHGRDDRNSASMGFDTNDEGAPGLTATKGSKRPRVSLDVSDGVHTRQVDLGKKLEHKFAPGGDRLIELDACDTGDANGLAPTLSRVLPGIRVKGTAGTLLENRITGAERPASTPDATRTFVVPRSQAGVSPGSYNAFPIK